MGDVKEFNEPFAMVTNKENPPFWYKSGDKFDMVTKGIPSINENECIVVYGSYTNGNNKKYLTSNGTDDIWINATDLDDTNECNVEDGKKKEQTRKRSTRQKKRKPTTSKRPRRSKRLAEKKRRSKKV